MSCNPLHQQRQDRGRQRQARGEDGAGNHKPECRTLLPDFGTLAALVLDVLSELTDYHIEELMRNPDLSIQASFESSDASLKVGAMLAHAQLGVPVRSGHPPTWL